MSKCQMKKFLPGGRCGGSNPCVKEDTSQTSQAFSQLMAAREAQDRMWTQPATTIPSNIPSQAIVLVKEEQKPPNKKDLISTILNGDM